MDFVKFSGKTTFFVKNRYFQSLAIFVNKCKVSKTDKGTIFAVILLNFKGGQVKPFKFC